MGTQEPPPRGETPEPGLPAACPGEECSPLRSHRKLTPQAENSSLAKVAGCSHHKELLDCSSSTSQYEMGDVAPERVRKAGYGPRAPGIA